MNYKMIVNIIGKIMVIMALLMLLPLTVSLIYFEPSSASNPTPIDGVRNIIAFAVPIYKNLHLHAIFYSFACRSKNVFLTFCLLSHAYI